MTQDAHLPLKPAWFHILLALADGARHGFAIRECVEERTGGALKLWPATLYGSVREMTEAGLIEPLEGEDDPDDDQRRRYYRLTRLRPGHPAGRGRPPAGAGGRGARERGAGTGMSAARPASVRLAVAAFRAAARALPADFRATYLADAERDLEETLRARHGERKGRGRRSRRPRRGRRRGTTDSRGVVGGRTRPRRSVGRRIPTLDGGGTDELDERRAGRGACPETQARLRGGGDVDAGAGDRRQRGDLHRGERRAAAPPPLPGRRPDRVHLAPRSGAWTSRS